MKKTLLATLIIALAAPGMTAFATTPSVISVEVESSSKITYSGTTEDGVLAVSCGLYDAEDNELDFNSVGVVSNSFNGEFDANSDAELVRCANYDGGVIIEKSIGEEAIDEEETGTTTNTETNEETETTAGLPNSGAQTISNIDDTKENSVLVTAAVVTLLALGVIIARLALKRVRR